MEKELSIVIDRFYYQFYDNYWEVLLIIIPFYINISFSQNNRMIYNHLSYPINKLKSFNLMYKSIT